MYYLHSGQLSLTCLIQTLLDWIKQTNIQFVKVFCIITIELVRTINSSWMECTSNKSKPKLSNMWNLDNDYHLTMDNEPGEMSNDVELSVPERLKSSFFWRTHTKA